MIFRKHNRNYQLLPSSTSEVNNMNHAVKLIILPALAGLVSMSLACTTRAQAAETISVVLETPIDSASVQEESEFIARIGRDLNVADGKMMPAGAIVRGRVATKKLVQRGSIGLVFDSVETPEDAFELYHTHLVTDKNKVRVRRGARTLSIRSHTYPRPVPGSPVCIATAIGLVSGRADGKSSMYPSLLDNPFRTLVVLLGSARKPVILQRGDQLEIQISSILPPLKP